MNASAERECVHDAIVHILPEALQLYIHFAFGFGVNVYYFINKAAVLTVESSTNTITSFMWIGEEKEEDEDIDAAM